MPESAQQSSASTRDKLRQGARLAILGIAINFLLASAKIGAGIWGNCYALIADGIESGLDIFSSVLLWFGLRIAAEPPDDEHPYGHGKAEPLAAVAVALAVIAAALGLAVQSIREILTPHHAPAPFTLLVLLAVVAIKETLFRKVHQAGHHLGSKAIESDAWHHRSDAITSASAFLGITIALLGGKGWEPADDWAALFACGLIGFNGFRILVPALHEVMDSAPPKELVDFILRTAGTIDGVKDLEKCRVRKMGLDLYVDIHVAVDGCLTVTEGHQIAHCVKDAIRSGLPAVADVLVHIEPVDRPSKTGSQPPGATV
jgi:cation diffusion facilitator family transporter